MAHSEFLADKVRQRPISKGKVVEKKMMGFLFIDPEGFDKDVDLDFWIEKALSFNKLIKK